MNSRKVYRPYSLFFAKILLYIAVMLVAMDITMYILFWTQEGNVAIKILTGIFGLVSIRFLNEAVSKLLISICFDDDGLFIIDDGKGKSYFIQWGEFSHVFIWKDGRNHPYLVITEEEMNEKDLKKKDPFFRKTFSQGIFFMRLFEYGDEESKQIIEFISKKISTVR